MHYKIYLDKKKLGGERKEKSGEFGGNKMKKFNNILHLHHHNIVFCGYYNDRLLMK